ncbi:MAG: acyl-CoA dehydrogenase family protein [Mycobacteriaceae bacterium]
MKFIIDKDQQAFVASIDAMLAKSEVSQSARSFAAGDYLGSQKIWKSLSELGVTGLAISTEYEGMDASSVDLVLALERLGYWCVPGPIVESIAVAPFLINNPDKLRKLALGKLIATVAYQPHTPRAVNANFSGLTLVNDKNGTYEAAIVATHHSVDPTRLLSDVKTMKKLSSTGMEDKALLLGVLGTAAQLLGNGNKLLETTADYAKTRIQFNRVIGQFQAVKHHLADVLIGIELARPLLYAAALAVDSTSATAVRDVSAAKVACAQAAYQASRVALQVHGAIGYTAECDLSLSITKVRALVSAWGTTAVHQRLVLDSLVSAS